MPSQRVVKAAEALWDYLVAEGHSGSKQDICQAIGINEAEFGLGLAYIRDEIANGEARVIGYVPRLNSYATVDSIDELRAELRRHVRYLATRSRRLLDGTMRPALKQFGRKKELVSYSKDLARLAEDGADLLAALNERIAVA